MKAVNIKNIALIAHVDHGKTTLVDAMLRQSGTFRDNQVVKERVMDSNDLERERGITILSKNTSIHWQGVKINIVDTPGHADFGGEVERILRMVNGVLLIVDAFEGPMPQTRFVLRKAMELNLIPIVVINKIDRPNARPAEVLNEIYDLFIELGANDKQIDFPVIYTSARSGLSGFSPDSLEDNLIPLFSTILKYIPAPSVEYNSPLQLLITNLGYDDYVGKIAIGLISRGKIQEGETVTLIKRDKSQVSSKVVKLYLFEGLERKEVKRADAGEIVAIAGISEANIGETIACKEKPEVLSKIKIDEPTLTVDFTVNDSPFGGREGKFVTSRHLRERLFKEVETNVSLRVEEAESTDTFHVSGRGELHLSILIETMRREGYGLEVSPPHVILIKMGGETLEPAEEVLVEVDQEYQGAVIKALGSRKADMKDMQITSIGTIRMNSIISTRNLIGFRSEFLIMTRGTGIIYQNFYRYQKYKGEVPGRKSGVQISMNNGKAVAYGLFGLQERGEIFINPGDDVYEGMIIGVNNKGHDLVVNTLRGKKLTNTRAARSDDAVTLVPPREITLEFALEFIEDDELVEITPKNIRLRKRYLTKNERKSKKRVSE